MTEFRKSYLWPIFEISTAAASPPSPEVPWLHFNCTSCGHVTTMFSVIFQRKHMLDSFNNCGDSLINHHKYIPKIESGHMVSLLMTTTIYVQNSMLNCGHTLRTLYTLFMLVIFPGQQTKLRYVQHVVPSVPHLSAWMSWRLSVFM